MPNPSSVEPFDIDRWRGQRSDMRYVLMRLRDALTASHTLAAKGAISDAAETMENYGSGREDMWAFYLRFTAQPRTPTGHNFARCENCDTRDPRDFMCYDGDQDYWYCAHCTYGNAYQHYWPDRQVQYYEPEPDYHDEEEEEVIDFVVVPGQAPRRQRIALNSYSSSPIRLLGLKWLAAKGEIANNRTRLFGCEIEFQTETKEQLWDILEWNHDVLLLQGKSIGIYKSDGSLRDGIGAEFCTLPMTRLSVPRLQPVLAKMVELGARAWNKPSCGLHVHVTQASASWTTWGLVERFFQNMRNQAFLDRIAGRRPNGFCYRGNRDGGKSIGLKQAMAKARHDHYDRFTGAPLVVPGTDAGRYNALNLTTNKPTVEFRLFRGNVAYHGVLRAIQFCDSIIEFAAQCSNTSLMDHEDYVTWLGQHAKGYPELRRLTTGKDTGEVITIRHKPGEVITYQSTAE